MLPFNASLFTSQYPTVVGSITSQQLNELWYNNALTIGNKVIALFNNDTPINPTTGKANSWNADTNTPTLSNSTGQAGQSYLCVVAGTVDFGAGDVSFSVYDIASFDNFLMQWVNVGQPYDYYWACQVLAHLCVLTNKPIVGRLNNATEGDISGSFDFKDTVNSAWWNQTTYGAMCWQQIKKRGGFTPYLSNAYQGILYQGDFDVY